MISRNKDYFALKEIMKKEKNFSACLQLFFLIVSLFIVIAVDNITPNEAVVKMKGIAADSFCQFLEVVVVAVDIGEEDDVEF